MREVFMVGNIEDNNVYLISNMSSACETCTLNGACSAGSSQRTMKINKSQFEKMPSIGDYVVIELPEFSVSKISFIIYGFPLIMFILFLVIAYFITKSDTYAFVSGIIGISISYGVIAYLDRTVFKKKYQPKVIEILPKRNNINLSVGIIK
ncbi:hypothetical protein XO10_03260 [Marinitoga sp. 1135]|uniref:Positive regulator of sigma E activity n=1 Tax=Marinitoga piezophila (strain DSM 14283 / JCM 11233 / KA3) TaxID=443254 RepID=H2J619_MARPK|nr:MULTISPECIES: SoxR reducing system RseC family protein [Marinitoga]AEX85080.1 Positive regulator of sigma E activity [Marinitoga piezophila KA3]APT75587.1 hypothetical protein LN42_03660 [Marinitoga sp. 1137]NUU95295.1 hypothetical protein [Marinitoga sp. 1135]NUU97229.1 hypothetical protein [Marinitoga sp. 1138]